MRAWCDQLDTPALGIRNIGAPRSTFGSAGVPHGRVGAEIVCDDTLVQYAAYWLLFPLACEGKRKWYHSIPIILVGMALHLFFFFRSVLFPLSLRFAFGCFVRWVGLGRMVFGDSANLWGCGLVRQVFSGGGYVAGGDCFGDALVG